MNTAATHPPPDENGASLGVINSIDMADPSNVLASTTPNSKPRQQQTKKLQTYVYQDFANADPSILSTGTCHERVPPQCLQRQKLPSKLASMLGDPDLASIVTWMPHGRSWKILNRELLSKFALPRYFGHSNHASFVRIVNAWGFRRVTKGKDHDSYYHELFLRGKPRLHERMKRLPICHRKTPVDKEDKCPDFYELAKTSPLPELPVARASATNQVAAAAGYLGNSMAVSATTHSLGLGNHSTNALFGNGNLHGSGPSPPSPSAIEFFLSNVNRQGGDLKLLRQQGSAQQHQEVQRRSFQGGNNASNVINQSLMHQLLRMQHTHPVQQARNMTASRGQPNSLLGAGNATSNLGQFASVAGTFAQPPKTTSSSNNALFSSLTPGSMNFLRHQPTKIWLSNDKISVDDVIQLQSIERTNELLVQKLASLQQDTMAMKQNAGDGLGANAFGQSSANRQSSLHASAIDTPAAPPNEEMLIRMIRRKHQMNAAFAPAKVLSHMKTEEGNGGMS